MLTFLSKAATLTISKQGGSLAQNQAAYGKARKSLIPTQVKPGWPGTERGAVHAGRGQRKQLVLGKPLGKMCREVTSTSGPLISSRQWYRFFIMVCFILVFFAASYEVGEAGFATSGTSTMIGT